MAGFGTSILMNSGASSYAESETSALQEKSGIDIDWKDNKTVGTILLAGGVIGFICAFLLGKMLFLAAALLILAGAAPLAVDLQAIKVTFPLILAGLSMLFFKNKIL